MHGLKKKKAEPPQHETRGKLRKATEIRVGEGKVMGETRRRREGDKKENMGRERRGILQEKEGRPRAVGLKERKQKTDKKRPSRRFRTRRGI